jgi:hypothetical protein
MGDIRTVEIGAGVTSVLGTWVTVVGKEECLAVEGVVMVLRAMRYTWRLVEHGPGTSCEVSIVDAGASDEAFCRRVGFGVSRLE